MLPRLSYAGFACWYMNIDNLISALGGGDAYTATNPTKNMWNFMRNEILHFFCKETYKKCYL